MVWSSAKGGENPSQGENSLEQAFAGGEVLVFWPLEAQTELWLPLRKQQ